jgi:DNA mismatch endonuclease, patch repair protein
LGISNIIVANYTYPEDIEVPRFNEANGFYTTSLRSKIMSRIRAKNTKPEIILRKALWDQGIRYRKSPKNLPGKPDIVIRKYKLAIFVDGEFWHGYDWENKKSSIKSNRGFWIPKIERNMLRDRQNTALLQKMGFTVLRFWQQQVEKQLGSCVLDILSKINIYDPKVDMD